MSRNYAKEYHNIKIADCPFCGSSPRLCTRNKTYVGGVLRHNCFVACIKCDARGKRVLEDDEFTPSEARERAVLAWNKRV